MPTGERYTISAKYVQIQEGREIAVVGAELTLYENDIENGKATTNNYGILNGI
jgi:hypothetical protein